MKKRIKNNKRAAVAKKPKAESLLTQLKKNRTTVMFALAGVALFSFAFLATNTAIFQKQKVEGGGFGSYKYPDKNSLNSSMPTRVIWHEPFFMDKKK